MSSLRIVVVGTVVMVLVWYLVGYPPVYYARSIEGRVVDAETGQPLKSVIITANWQLERGTFGGNVPAGQIEVKETVTDTDGRFRFPAWGPQITFRGGLVYDDPQLLVFKPGYRFRELRNTLVSDYNTSWIRNSDWDGKTIELKKFEETIEAYENQFESFNDNLEHIAAENPEECGWKQIPSTIRAMYQERMRLIALGANPHTLASIDKRLMMNDEYFTKEGNCGSPKAFFGDFAE